jgi:hypothetical protein
VLLVLLLILALILFGAGFALHLLWIAAVVAVVVLVVSALRGRGPRV